MKIKRLPDRLSRWLLLPDLEPPGLFRLQIDRLIGGTVEIDFETGMVNDETVRQPRDHLSGKGVFLPQPFVGG